MLAFLLAAVSAGAVEAPHPDSLSRSLIRVDGDRLELTLRCQTLSVLEVLPELDRDGDGRLSDAELEPGRGALEAYVLEHYRIDLDRDEEPLPLVGELVRAGTSGEAPAGPLDLQWIQLRFEFRAPVDSGPHAAPTAVLGAIGIRVSLFLVGSPDHSDLCGVVWNGEREVRHLFAPGSGRWVFEPAAERRPGVFRSFLELGVNHILGGWDHLAFLVALLVASSRLRSLVGVVTAFTVAHSITLGLAALNPGGLLDRVPERFVELAIALSIAYVGAETLLRREARDPWIEAFAFGLLHGLGFAGFLGDALVGETLVLTALVGFNVGVEAGQLAVVGVLAAALVLMRRLRPAAPPAVPEVEGEAAPRPALAPRAVQVVASAGVVVVGLYWFCERAGWV